MEQIWPEKKERGNPPEKSADISRRSGPAYVQECSAKLHAYAISILLPFIWETVHSPSSSSSSSSSHVPSTISLLLPALLFLLFTVAPRGERGERRIAIACCTEEEERGRWQHMCRKWREGGRPRIVGQKCTIVHTYSTVQHRFFVCLVRTSCLTA